MNNIPIFLSSVLVARFKALEAVAFPPFFFFTVEYHVFRYLTPVNCTPSLYKCSTPEECLERERYVCFILFAPFALFPTHPQGEGEERWVTRQKRLQGRLPIAQVEHKTQ